MCVCRKLHCSCVGSTCYHFVSTETRRSCDHDWPWDGVCSIPSVHRGEGRSSVQRSRFTKYYRLSNTRTLTHSGNMLFFGCRSEHADYFFRREWLPLVSDGWLQLCCAFSRDQQHKEYVQHKLLAAGQAVWEWLGGGDCHVFIAG